MISKAVTLIVNMSALLSRVLNSFIGILFSCFMGIIWIPIGNKKALIHTVIRARLTTGERGKEVS